MEQRTYRTFRKTFLGVIVLSFLSLLSWPWRIAYLERAVRKRDEFIVGMCHKQCLSCGIRKISPCPLLELPRNPYVWDGIDEDGGGIPE